MIVHLTLQILLEGTMPEIQNSMKDNTIRQGEKGVQNLDSSPFSHKGFELLKEKISDYIDDLIKESVRASKRSRSDTVSPVHVERASEYLVSSSGRRLYKHLGTIGGIILGAVFSNTLSMTSTGQYSASGTLLYIALGMVSAFLIALHMAKD
jgi:hypothetical protein